MKIRSLVDRSCTVLIISVCLWAEGTVRGKVAGGVRPINQFTVLVSSYPGFVLTLQVMNRLCSTRFRCMGWLTETVNLLSPDNPVWLLTVSTLLSPHSIQCLGNCPGFRLRSILKVTRAPAGGTITSQMCAAVVAGLQQVSWCLDHWLYYYYYFIACIRFIAA